MKLLFTILFTLFIPLSMFAEKKQDFTIKIADDVYRYGNPNVGYFSMFIVSNKGIIVIEPMNTAHSKAMLKAIRKISKQPIRYLLHSHNHWDHSKGAKIFLKEGAKIVAHKKAFKWMKNNPHSDLTLPNQIWTGEKTKIILGNKTIELYYFGMNHGLGMTAFLLPKEKILYLADLVTPNRMPFVIADFNIKETVNTLRKIETMDFTKAVFSHSHSKKAVGNKKDVIQTREFFEDLKMQIISEFQKGTSFYAMPTTLKLDKYKHWDFYKEWLAINTWTMMFQMEMGSFPWHEVPEKNSIK